MHGIYSALTTPSLSEGIKNIDVFYDTAFINLKTFDISASTNTEYLLIEKLRFDYAINSFGSEKETLLSFGNTGYTNPNISNGNCFIKNILLESEKTVLIFGLSSNSINLSASLGSQSISGRAIIPVIYSHSLNTSETKLLYPDASSLSSLNNFIMGKYLSAQNPIVELNKDTNKIDFVFKTNIQTLGISSKRIDVINNIQFDYNGNVYLTCVRQMTSLPSGDDFEVYKFVGTKTTENGKLLISYKNGAIQLCNF